MMKRIFTFSLLMLAFAMNAVAYEKGKLIERHIFRLMSPDDGDVGPNEFTIEWDGTGWWSDIRTLKSISQRGAFGSSKIEKQTYLNWFDHSARFVAQDHTAWIISKNDRQDLGFGLMNNSNEYKSLRIAGLKTGDIVRFEYYRNDANVSQFPQFQSTNATQNGTTVTEGQNVYGTEDIIMNSNGDLDINCPPRMLLRQVTITHANYKKATYHIDEVHDDHGNTGYRYTITGSGVLEEKRGAVPYITMQFGNESDMTVVRDYGDGNYAASCVIDPEHNFDLDNGAPLTANYKRRYQNESGQFVRWSNVRDSYNNVGTQEEQDAVKELAQNEVNLLKGQEWTLFRTNTIWDTDPYVYEGEGENRHIVYEDGHNGESGYEKLNWIEQRRRAYEWIDDFHNTWPLYGTYFYFFPEVKGKLSIKFYCEGNGQHLPFWFKAQDGTVVDAYVTGANNQTGNNIYELNDIDVVSGGAYYLCANPTLIEGEHPVARLISYQFVPEFRIAPIYKVVDDVEENGSVTAACEILGGPYTELNGNVDTSEFGKYKTHEMVNDQPVEVWTDFLKNGEKAPLVECLGNIKSCVPVVRTESGHQYLDITQIKYKEGANVNKGGAIVVNLCCDAGKGAFVLTIAYDAATAQWSKESGKNVRVGTTTEVKRWDFFTNVLDIGQYKNNQGEQYRYPTDQWKGSSTLFKEVHKYDEMTADWRITYADIQNEGIEPIFKSVYDMEGDNADMLHETAGLVFLAESNLVGIYNENNTSNSDFQDRYIGLMGDRQHTIDKKPRTIIIPYLKQDDRIVIKMGSYGNADDNVTPEPATLRIKGANDALGNPIPDNADYVIGGSIPGVENPSKPFGEYHFISTGGHFELSAYDAKLLKLYSIEIYRNAANNNADILTENELTGLPAEVTFTDKDTETTKYIGGHVRYHGYQEKSTFHGIDQVRGNLVLGTDNEKNKYTVTTTEAEPYCTVSAKVSKGDFGSFRAKMAVKTKDANNTYVTDYVPGSLAVGYRETKSYPYTWDFTDLRGYANSHISNEESNNNLLDGYKGWVEKGNSVSAMRIAPAQDPGVLFANGGQLYANTKMFDESAGIGFKRDESLSLSELKDYDEGLQLLTDGLKLDCPNDNEYRLVIPQVGADAAIYVRATPLTGVSSKYSTDGTNANTWPEKATASDGDKIYAYKNSGSNPVDIELWLNHMIIRKIAVATDEKKVNELGWNTESRDHAIDPSLLPYMTGKDFRTYIASAIDTKDGEKIVKLTRIDGGSGVDNITGKTDGTTKKYIVPAATKTENNVTVPYNGSSNACIIRYYDGSVVDIFEEGKGFHLFVPDMHDAAGEWPDNLLKARVTPTTNNDKVLRDEDEKANYAFTNKWKYVDADGKELEGRGGQKVGDQAFYRIMQGGASSDGNQAYLSIADNIYPARMSIVFEGEKSDDSEATGIATVEDNSVDSENARFYNLSGQQLSGKPNRSGLYIVNGKKVSIKNK